MTRLLAAALAALVAAFAAVAQAESLKVAISQRGFWDSSFVEFAEAAGFFKEAGLVVDRPDGTRRLYELNPDGIGALRAYFERFWTQALTSFKHRVEQQEEQ